MSEIERVTDEDGQERAVFNKMRAVMTIPRWGSTEALIRSVGTLAQLKIPLFWFGGAYRYEQGMQLAFEGCIDAGIEWVVTLDYDSIFDAGHVQALLSALARDPKIDAIAALQKRRGSDRALLFCGSKEDIQVTGAPIPAIAAHFGLTVIKASLLKSLPMEPGAKVPTMFRSVPGPDGGYGDGRIDPDMYFWKVWREAGHTIAIHPGVRIGHQEEFVGFYNEKMEAKLCYADQFDAIQRGDDPGEVLDALKGTDEKKKEGKDDDAENPLAAALA